MGFFDKLFGNNSTSSNTATGNYGKGPIVKTGPTAGQVRSRNNNGQWRAKRSDAGIPRGPKK